MQFFKENCTIYFFQYFQYSLKISEWCNFWMELYKRFCGSLAHLCSSKTLVFINNKSFKLNMMNLKRIYEILPTGLGISGAIYTTVIFTNTLGSTGDTKKLIIYGVLSMVFFASCVSLIIQQKTYPNYLQKIKS